MCIRDRVRSGLSAGRVQSVAVKLLVEREREIRAFVPEESWKIEALVRGAGIDFPIEFIKQDGKTKKWKNESDALKFFATHGIDLATAKPTKDKKGSLVYSISHSEDFALADIEKKESRRTPGAPFTTSTLQQEAARKLGYGVKQTMDIAQRLYPVSYTHLTMCPLSKPHHLYKILFIFQVGNSCLIF